MDKVDMAICDRNGCYNGGCERYNNDYGYICNECLEELINGDPNIDLWDFFETKKGVEKSYTIIENREYFEEIFFKL